MADRLFEDPRLARLYDPFDPDRSDLDLYLALVDEFQAQRVLDVGCGTGTFACQLARRGVDVVAVDPAEASLHVARTKPGADQVRWVQGDVRSLPPLEVDLATMTANVAQVFVTDEEWRATLHHVRRSLRPRGRLAFETRVPERQPWRDWNKDASLSSTEVPGVGRVEAWVETTSISGPLVSFRWTYVFDADGAVLTSDSTLRFRTRGEITESLEGAGFFVEDVRDAPDRPGREWVFIAGRLD